MLRHGRHYLINILRDCLISKVKEAILMSKWLSNGKCSKIVSIKHLFVLLPR